MKSPSFQIVRRPYGDRDICQAAISLSSRILCLIRRNGPQVPVRSTTKAKEDEQTYRTNRLNLDNGAKNMYRTPAWEQSIFATSSDYLGEGVLEDEPTIYI